MSPQEKFLKKNVFSIAVWMVIFVMISVNILSPLVSSRTEIISTSEEETHARSRTDTDADNDGVSDDLDICPEGNGVVIISIDYFETEETTFGNYDPYFHFGVDGNNDGSLSGLEYFDSEKFYFPDQNIVYGQGYPNGSLWHGVDVYDGITSVGFYIAAFDKDGVENDLMDITSNSNTKEMTGTYEISWNGSVVGKEYFWDDGELDVDIGEDDAYIEIHLEIIKGTTIESVTPQSQKEIDDEPTWMDINEGDTMSLEITDVFSPTCISAPIGYEWYYVDYDDYLKDPGGAEYHCVQSYVNDWNENESNTGGDYGKEGEKFQLFANYGSAGKYLFMGVAFIDIIDDFNLYWWDIELWCVNIIHVNTIPEAEIDITPMNDIKQLDQVSFSAWRSFDIDGDELTYTWELNGVGIGNERDIQHVFYDAGVYNLTLTVEDDESATDVAVEEIRIENYDVSGASPSTVSIEPGKEIKMDTDYETTATYRKSKSTKFDLIWGMALEASVSFVSETIIKHEGSVVYEFDDSSGDLKASLRSTKDKFNIEYRPYFEIRIDLYDSSQRYNFMDVKIPVPLLNNDEYDEDGKPLFTIPGDVTLEVYTWDKPAVIYSNEDPLNNASFNLQLAADPIDIAQIDLFEVAGMILKWIPPNPVTTTIGTLLNIVEIFGKLFLTTALNLKPFLEQEFLLLFDEGNSEFNRIANFNKIDSRAILTNDTANVYSIIQAHAKVDLTISIDLVFELTEWGQRIYGFYKNLEEKGFLATLWDTAKKFVTTGDVPKKEKEWRKTLWESGTLLVMTGKVTALCDYYYEYTPDLDGDGVKNVNDAFPYDPAASLDSDSDGYPDAWNKDKSQGDSTTGIERIDKFPVDPGASMDSDGDGHPDEWNVGMDKNDSTSNLEIDGFPNDPAASVDTDGDGYPDEWNPGKGKEDSTTGLTIDTYPRDISRHSEDELLGSMETNTIIIIVIISVIVITLVIVILMVIKKKKRKPVIKEEKSQLQNLQPLPKLHPQMDKKETNVNKCMKCGNYLEPEWFVCPNCKTIIEKRVSKKDEKVQGAPKYNCIVCKTEMVFVEQHRHWWCGTCKKYDNEVMTRGETITKIREANHPPVPKPPIN